MRSQRTGSHGLLKSALLSRIYPSSKMSGRFLNSLRKFQIGLATEMAIVVGPRPSLEVLIVGTEVEVEQVGMRVFLRDFDLRIQDRRKTLVPVLKKMPPSNFAAKPLGWERDLPGPLGSAGRFAPPGDLLRLPRVLYQTRQTGALAERKASRRWARMFTVSPMKSLFRGAAFALLIPFHAGVCEDDAILPETLPSGGPKSKMMTDWLKAEAFAALDRREAAFEAVKSPEEIEKWQAERKAFFLKQIGGLPERTPLNPKVTGTMKGDGYRVEKLYFESQPGLHVTANLYLPLGTGPFPAVIHPTGHSNTGKGRDLYQMASITIARGGCAALCYDPIGQGERQQIPGPEGKLFASTSQHSLINQGLTLLGSNTSRIMIWDGMRAIDYLQSRPDIIADKIGCTGISGGGTNTSYLMALDDRIVAAAPGCYLTGFRSLLSTLGPQDAEQNVHGQIAFGMDQADYVLMRLPKPTLIMAATSDYFGIEGAWDIFREGKRFATRQGFPERVDLVEPATDHGFPPEMRLAAANWMRRWLLDLDEPIREEGELNPLAPEEMFATPNGKVLDLEGARSAFKVTQAWCEKFEASRKENAKPENREALLKKVRTLIGAREFADLPDIAGEELGNDQFILESEPGIWLPVQLVRNSKTEYTIYLNGAGTAVAMASREVENLATETGNSVIAVDLRGLGETSVTGKPSGFDKAFGRDWKDTSTASLLGKSYVGMRTEDIWQIVRALRKKTGIDDLKPNLVAIREAAIPALHAAALEPDLFGTVRISHTIDSWKGVVETLQVRNQQPNLVFGALREYDLPMLRDAIGKDRLTVENTILADWMPSAN